MYDLSVGQNQSKAQIQNPHRPANFSFSSLLFVKGGSIMASRAVNLWRSVVNRAGANRQFVTATAPRLKPVAIPADFMQQGEQRASKSSKGDFIPVYVALGLILLSMSFGAYTAKQQIAYNPSVRVSKRRRESVPEVEDPDRVLTEADKFINKSLFRKIAHVQDFEAVRAGISDPTRPDPFRAPRRAETLYSVGVNPRGT